MRVFDWNTPASWLAEVDVYAACVLTPEVKAKIAKSRPECWSDSFEWLPVEAGAERFSQVFANHYERIRAFHGCRPLDVASYFDRGLQGQASEEIERQFLAMFEDVPETILKTAIDELSSRKDSERGRFWVVLEERELIEDCGHYLIQGSEYLMSLAATLSRIHPKRDYRLRLREVGIPTIFELNIPVSHVSEAQLRSLTNLVLAKWGEQVARRRLGAKVSPCLTIRKSLDPTYLVGHRHPQKIRDPHFGRSVYINSATRCSRCTD